MTVARWTSHNLHNEMFTDVESGKFYSIRQKSRRIKRLNASVHYETAVWSDHMCNVYYNLKEGLLADKFFI